MCSIIGVVGENVMSDIINMLHTLKHRGPDGCGVYSRGKIYLNNDILDCEDSSFIIAHNLLSIVGCDELQPFMSENLVLVSNAEIYNYKELISKYDFDLSSNSDCEVILKLIEHNYHDNLKEAILKSIDLLDGDYAFCVSDGKDYVVVRDNVGVKPLYYGSNCDKFAFASEQKALQKIGINDIYNLNPRFMIYNGDVIQIRDCYKRCDFYNDYDVAKEKLKNAIVRSVRKRVQDLDEVALLFSGGVDSTLIALILKKLGIKTTLYSVGVETSQDLKYAKKIAHDIDIPLTIQIINQEIIEKSFYPTVNTIEDTNLMKIGVGMTIKLTSHLAHMDNHKVILSGQGADELFAGYNRYKKKYTNHDLLNEELTHDLNNIYDVNLERDDKATMSNSVELRVPFLDKDVIDVASHMPIDYLLDSCDDKIRKHILRDVAYELGLFKEAAYRPKKAAQYGTGIDKIIKKKIIKKQQYNKILQ